MAGSAVEEVFRRHATAGVELLLNDLDLASARRRRDLPVPQRSLL
jgi:hypothetical protein